MAILLLKWKMKMRKKLGVWPHETALGQHGGFTLSAKSAVQHYSAIGCSYKIMEILILRSRAFFFKKSSSGGIPMPTRARERRDNNVYI